jgi:hypothetical protein
MTSKKSTPIAVLRYTLGPHDGQEEIFAATVQCSVSWVKKASAGQRFVTPKTAHKVSMATGVSEEWLVSGDPKAPILERDNVTPYTWDSYARWRQETIAPVRSVDSRVVAAFASEITSSLIAANEVGRVNTAINDLWKFSKAMKNRYGAPNELRASIEFTWEVGREMVELSNIELRNTTLRNDR